MCNTFLHSHRSNPESLDVAGGEGGSRLLQTVHKINCERVRATEHAARGPFHFLERRHGLAEIVERGVGVKRFELTSGHAAAGSDQGFLQQYFRENEGFLSLPHAYNVLKRREKKLGKSFRIQDVFVLHLVGGKPWEPGDPGAGEYPLSHGAWHAIRRECGLPDDGY